MGKNPSRRKNPLPRRASAEETLAEGKLPPSGTTEETPPLIPLATTSTAATVLSPPKTGESKSSAAATTAPAGISTLPSSSLKAMEELAASLGSEMDVGEVFTRLAEEYKKAKAASLLTPLTIPTTHITLAEPVFSKPTETVKQNSKILPPLQPHKSTPQIPLPTPPYLLNHPQNPLLRTRKRVRQRLGAGLRKKKEKKRVVKEKRRVVKVKRRVVKVKRRLVKEKTRVVRMRKIGRITRKKLRVVRLTKQG